MIANNKRGASRRSGKRSGPRRNKGQLTDIPPPIPSDIVTRSVVPPRVSEYTVVRGMQTATVTVTPTASQNPTYYFTLGNANVGAGTFDQYRIPAVRFNIRPQQNAIGLTTNSTTAVTSIYCVIDYDDDAPIATLGQTLAYSTCVALPPGQSLSRTFRPHIATAAYNGAFNGYANMQDVWIDSAYNNVRHYGVKLFVPGVAVAQTQLQSWDIEIEYFIELKKSI